METLQSIFTHEHSKVSRVLYNLKLSISKLEQHDLSNPKVKAELEKCRELEIKLQEVLKTPALLKNLSESSLKEYLTLACGFHETQASKRSKRTTWKNLDQTERQKRNKSIREAWQKSKLTLNGFAINQAAKHELSVTQIKKIVKQST